MCQKNPGHGPARIAGERARPAARREFAPGGSEWRLSPSGPPAQTVAIGFNKANANYVPYTNPEITS
ncbi:MAG TPA: hypothetical protein VGP28_09690 [Methylocella sp.]|jgi:hypothetical protein|nr:hypothetical protein [Methylocella sp.]